MRTKLLSIFFLLTVLSEVHAEGSISDTLQLQNKFLSVKIKTKGAELISIYNKPEKFEQLWQGEKTAWSQQSPILFPIVGKLKNKTYQIDGKTYSMPNHGFASKSNFTIISKSNKKVVLELIENEETLKMYPFKFRLLVSYTLKKNKLTICNTVKNTDTQEIYFSMGAHPGFNIPFSSDEKYDDYYLEFENNETVNRLPLTKKKGLVSKQIVPNYIKNNNQLTLSHQLFKDRVVILEGLKSNSVTIKSDASKFGIKMSGIHEFPYFGIWSPSKVDAPLVCLEPWYGISDTIDSAGDFKTKKGIQKLQVGKEFVMDYSIEIISFK